MPTDCSVYRSVETGWSLLSCTVNNKLVCGGGKGKKCDCSGSGCSFDLPVGAVCHGDSTPRYNGELPNWKTCACATPGATLPCQEWPECQDGKVERSEYPPKPASGWDCGATTVWSATPGVQIEAESEGYGARLKFPGKGTFKVKACRKGSTSLCTEKTAKVK
jgi:hypothetical protein